MSYIQQQGEFLRQGQASVLGGLAGGLAAARQLTQSEKRVIGRESILRRVSVEYVVPGSVHEVVLDATHALTEGRTAFVYSGETLVAVFNDFTRVQWIAAPPADNA